MLWLTVGVIGVTYLFSPALSLTTSPACVCGERGPLQGSLDLKITGGQDAGIQEFPWAALLQIHDGEQARMCGGSLVNDRFVLTAAHCLPFASELNITILLGEHDRYKRGETDTLVLRAKPYRYYRHWRYTFHKNIGAAYDFALIELEKSVDFAKYPHIRPVCLPSTKNIDYDGVEVSIAGWGAKEVGLLQIGNNLVKGFPISGPARKLQKLNARLIKQVRCRDIYHQVDEKLRITESNLCAFSSRGDSCEGDSGGGLVMQSPENRHYEIVGVVSYGVGCNSTFKGSKIPGVYSRVSTAVDWILSQAGEGVFCQKKIPRASHPGVVTIGALSEWGGWGEWSRCDRPCGVGRKARRRYCQGKRCSSRGHTQKTQEVLCNIHACEGD